MSLLHSFILGIIEGITEFLPVSSTGHMVLAQILLSIKETDFMVTFDIAIQLGAILAVVVLYGKRFFDMALIKKLIIAFIPTGIAGVFIFKHLKALLQNPFIIIGSLFIGGIIILIADSWYKKHAETNTISHIGYKEALILGLCQTLAIIPGISRSGAMIVGGMYMKLEKKVLTEFTFLLAVPTMCAATLYSIYKHPETLANANNYISLLVGAVTAFFVALIVIRLFLEYIRRHSFSVFGYYRIAISLVAFFILLNL